MDKRKKRKAICVYPSLWKRVTAQAQKRNMSASKLVAIMFEACLVRIENDDNDLLRRLSE